VGVSKGQADARPSSTEGEVLVMQPGAVESYWQLIPANGYIDVPAVADRAERA
jgi:hypothetical protein